MPRLWKLVLCWQSSLSTIPTPFCNKVYMLVSWLLWSLCDTVVHVYGAQTRLAGCCAKSQSVQAVNHVKQPNADSHLKQLNACDHSSSCSSHTSPTVSAQYAAKVPCLICFLSLDIVTVAPRVYMYMQPQQTGQSGWLPIPHQMRQNWSFRICMAT